MHPMSAREATSCMSHIFHNVADAFTNAELDPVSIAEEQLVPLVTAQTRLKCKPLAHCRAVHRAGHGIASNPHLIGDADR